MLKLQFSAIIDGVTAKKDKTLSLKFGTQELSPDDTSLLFDLMGKQLWLGVAETPIEELNVPDLVPEFRGEKTPSQVMRGIIYRIWEKSDRKMPFPKYYDNYMFKLNEQLKDKLD